MPGNKIVLTLLFLALFVTLVLLGCEGDVGPQGPPGGYLLPTISGSITINDPDDSVAYATASVNNSQVIPGVQINGYTLDLYLTMSGNLSYFSSPFPLRPGNTATLQVSWLLPDSTPALAQAQVIVPGAFQILQPDTSLHEIPVGQGLQASWSPSAGASYYDVSFYYNYLYTVPGLSSSQQHIAALDTLMAGTSLNIPAELIYPSTIEIDSAFSVSGHLSISAVADPWQAGQSGNISGDGVGTFKAVLDAKTHQFGFMPY